jgi:hypothetical protein
MSFIFSGLVFRKDGVKGTVSLLSPSLQSLPPGEGTNINSHFDVVRENQLS